MQGNEPVAPQNFDHVERYVSNLPIQRVEQIRSVADGMLKTISQFNEQQRVVTNATIVEMLAGYIIELTQENK